MTVPYVLMCSKLSTSVRRQAGQVPYVEWLGSEAGWWHGWCHLPSPPTLRGTVGTPSRAAFFTPKQSHENERTRYLYITRNPRYFKRLTFPQRSKPISEKIECNSLSVKRGGNPSGSISSNIHTDLILFPGDKEPLFVLRKKLPIFYHNKCINIRTNSFLFCYFQLNANIINFVTVLYFCLQRSRR